MDLKTRILNWVHAIGENPAILALVMISAIAALFIAAIYIDAFIKHRRRKKHWPHQR
jgi:hypothetical protein